LTDRLTDEERILAWKSSWNPSFAGVAIVNRDFTFRSVNPQFCKLLGVTPAELVGERFQDVTPMGVKQLDEKNAQLIIDGSIDFYLLPKEYEFSGGRRVKVVLLVTRVPHEGEFQFFVSRIMLDEKGGLLSIHETEERSHLEQSSLTWTTKVLDFLAKYWIPIAITSAVAAGIIKEIFQIDLTHEK